ncbi:MAG: thiosulfate oxidation carrier protein SoxY [Rhodospirillaceae bacterium]
MVTKIVMQPATRRDVMRLAGTGALAAMFAGILPGIAGADPAAAAAAIAKLTGGKAAKEGKIKMDVPQIAENGRTVPVSFEVESPMTDKDYVKSVHIFADKNPTPDVSSYHFTQHCGKAAVSFRMRLGGTQNVIAVAQMSDGSVYMAKAPIKVTIGGCGG